MRELDFLPQWYVILDHERRLLRRSVLIGTMAVMTALAVQCGAGWVLGRSRAALVQSQQRSARLAADEGRERTLCLRRDQLRTEYMAWTRAAAPVSAVALAQQLGKLMPGNVTLTQLKVGSTDASRAGTVHLTGVAGDEVDVAALLLSLNGERKFDQVVLRPSKDQRLLGRPVKRFELSFVAAADAGDVLP